MGEKDMTRTGNGCGCGNQTRRNYGTRNYGMTRQGTGQTGHTCGCKNAAPMHRTGYEAHRGYDVRTERGDTTSDTSCCEAMETLRKIEFAIVDVALYLNAYPDSDCALAYYRKLIGERECLLRKIHEECGPTTLYDNVSETCWKWTDGPWPWHYNGN